MARLPAQQGVDLRQHLVPRVVPEAERIAGAGGHAEPASLAARGIDHRNAVGIERDRVVGAEPQAGQAGSAAVAGPRGPHAADPPAGPRGARAWAMASPTGLGYCPPQQRNTPELSTPAGRSFPWASRKKPSCV